MNLKLYCLPLFLLGFVVVYAPAVRLAAVKDATLQAGYNLGSFQYLLVGLHKGWPKKRIVIQFEDIPSTCSNVTSAVMYMKYAYAHKASWFSDSEAPIITRRLCSHQILRSWNEGTIGSTTYMTANIDYLNNYCTDLVTLTPSNLEGLLSVANRFLAFDITETARNWVSGDPNYGIIVIDLNENLNGRDRRFWSREAAVEKRPYLEVICGNVVTCSVPSTPSNGQRIYRGRNYNDRVSFRCNTGYRLRGSSSRTCQSNGQWSGTQPTCNIVTCSVLRTPSNGQRTYRGRNYNDRVTFSCNTGYRLTGSSSRTCQANGKWSGTQPTCNIVVCNGVPSAPSNGQRTYRGRNYNDRVTFSCNTGYLLRGSSSRTCQSNGQWSGTQTTCVRSCGTPNLLINGQRSYTTTVIGSTVMYTCVTGYIRTAGSYSRTCQSNGLWSGSHPTCSRYCGDLGITTNVRRAITGTTEGHTITYTCNTGYKLLGSTVRTCQSNGIWSGSHSECSRYCGDTIIPANGMTSLTGNTEGHKIAYFCKVGFTLSGNAIRTCESSGQWSGSLPSCLRVCGDPNPPLNGMRNYTGITEGEQVTYTCSTGYKLSGASSRTCGANGQWSGSQPSCERDCGDSVSPTNGRTSNAGTTVGNTVIFTCHTGYTLTGSNSRTCQNNGQWSGTQPSCLLAIDGGWSAWVKGACSITCGGEGIQVDTRTCNNPTPQNGGQACNGTAKRTIPCFTCPCEESWSPWSPGPCSQTCGRGTRMRTRNCTTPDQPDCCQGSNTTIELCELEECPRVCGVPNSPLNGMRNYTGITEGEQVTYTCSTGYKLSGASSRTCGANGQWSGSQPSCERDCGDSVSPNNGMKSNSGTTVGNTVIFTCHTGYTLTGSNSRTCQNNGQWSGTQPSCLRAIDGGWSAWVKGACSITCGGEGIQVDTRTCDNPTPQNGGQACNETGRRTIPCFTCPCEEAWSPWSPEPCSKTCGRGTRRSTRHCTTPDRPDCCQGSNTTIELCELEECPPIHGGWSPWSEASSCTVSCGGGGRKVLVRTCNNPVPDNGGNFCEGPSFKIDTNCGDCPCDAGWSSWSSGACRGPCGQKGTALATRKCRGPSECCPGESRREEDCTNVPCSG